MWALVRVYGLVTLSVHGLVDDDLDLYARWARLWSQGARPYADVALEYPPGILPFLRLPAQTDLTYAIAFVSLALLADLVVLVLLRRAGARSGAGLWLLTPLLLGPVTWCRTDVFVALALVAAVHAHRRGCAATSAVCLTAAASLKLWPAVLLVLAVPLVEASRRRRFIIAGALSAGAVGLAPFLVFGGHGLRAMLDYHAERGLQVETLAAAPLHAARLFGADLEVVLQHGSLEFPAADVSGLLLALALLTLVGLARCAQLVLRGSWRAEHDLAGLVVCVTMVVALSGKVLSAQYAVWILAAVVLVVDSSARPHRLAAAAAAFLMTTQYVYPFTFGGLLEGSAVSVAAAALHAACLVWLAAEALSGAGFGRPSRPPSPVASQRMDVARC